MSSISVARTLLPKLLEPWDSSQPMETSCSTTASRLAMESSTVTSTSDAYDTAERELWNATEFSSA